MISEQDMTNDQKAITQQTTEFFNENGYVSLSNVLSSEKTELIKNYMFDLKEKGELINDAQCPLSDAIYGAPVIDNLLESLADGIGAHVGKKLLPAYSYARIYRPGEILKRHLDRPSCEISATLTIAYDAKHNWPIYFFEDKELPVTINVGDCVVYKGCDIVHWRPPFKGNWHIQVFLHYVDAEGPYTDFAMDGREKLGIPKNTGSQEDQEKINKLAVSQHNKNNNEQQIQANDQQSTQQTNGDQKWYPDPVWDGVLFRDYKNDVIPGAIQFHKQNLAELVLTDEECDKVIDFFKEDYPSPATVGGGNTGDLKREIRSADVFNIPRIEEFKWLWEKICRAVVFANKEHFDYDISGITHSLQLLRYNQDHNVPGHYDWHIDAGPQDSYTRKISLSVQLSKPEDYEGCELKINNHGKVVTATKERGSISLFPSYMPHTVTPIEKGERYSIVIWVHGSRSFR